MTEEQKLKKLESLLAMMDESLTKQEFVDSFENVIKYVKKIETSNQIDIAAIKQVADDLLTKLKDDANVTLSELKQKSFEYTKIKLSAAELVSEAVEALNNAFYRQMEGVDKKLAAVKNGKDADENKIIESVLAQIPPVVLPPEQFGEDFRNALEALPDGDKLSIEAIQDLQKYLDEIREAQSSGKNVSLVNSPSRGVFLFIDGVKKGLISNVNLAAGTGMTLVHTVVNGQDTLTFNSTGVGGGHTIENEGTPLTQRTNLNFVGAGVTVIDGGAGPDSTIVTIPLSSYTDEQAQDATGAMAANSTFVSLAYNDATPSLTPSLSATGTPDATKFLRGDNTWATPAGSGDMVLASTQTNSGLKTFLDGTLGLRNVANTFTALFTNAITAARTYTWPDASGTVALTSDLHAAVTVTDSAEIDFTLAGQNITASIIAGSIDETKLDASTNASLDLADTASQPGHTHTAANITDFTEAAQDATGAMVATSIVYNDAGATLQRAALTGAITASQDSNTTALGSFTKAELDGAVSDGNVLYVGDVTTNATHTGEVTGSGALTVDKTAITNKTLVTAAAADKILIADASDTDNLKYVTAQAIADLVTGGTVTNFNDIYIDQSGGTSDTYGAITGTINGSNAVFTVSQAVYATGTLQVWLNGQLLTQGTGEDWTETTPASGTFTFIVAPATGSEITAAYQKIVTNSSTVVTSGGTSTDNALARFNGTTGVIQDGTLSASDVTGGQVVLSTIGNNDLVLQTGNATTGNITITDGDNGDITANINGYGGAFSVTSTGVTTERAYAYAGTGYAGLGCQSTSSSSYFDVYTEDGNTSLTLQGGGAGGGGPAMDLQHNSISPAANDITGSINFFGKDSGAANQEYARIYSVIADPTAASEDGILKLGVVTAGTVANELELTGAALYPTTNDGLALGTSALSYADLFLASSGVINFNNGNATLTHSAGLLTSNVDIAVPDEAYGVGWNGSLEVPTKNALYDKIETLTGITRSVVVTSGSATMGSAASTDYVYMVAGAHTMSLPAASGNTNRYTVKNNHSANITIDTVGAETVEGAASISIAPEESVDIISDGTNFRII